MGLISMPRALADVCEAMARREANGEIVKCVQLSPDLHHQIIEEVWMYDREIIYYIESILLVPVKVNPKLENNDFALDTEKGRHLND